MPSYRRPQNPELLNTCCLSYRLIDASRKPAALRVPADTICWRIARRGCFSGEVVQVSGTEARNRVLKVATYAESHAEAAVP